MIITYSDKSYVNMASLSLSLLKYLSEWKHSYSKWTCGHSVGRRGEDELRK